MNIDQMLYQVRHPWHWLTYGQNTAAVGLILLYLYTRYTRKMMWLAQQTRRAELYPVLILQNSQASGDHLEFLIVNVGNGSLLNAMRWGSQVNSEFKIGNAFLERPPDIHSVFAGTMVKDSTLTIRSRVNGSELRVLEVIDGTDSVGGRHQFCILRSLIGSVPFEHQVKMMHPLEFFPLRQRLVLKAYEWRARLKRAIDRSH